MRAQQRITQEQYLSLIIKIFNTPDGELLLSVWEQQFLYRKVANQGDDLLSIGLKQGEQQFVLSIINLMEDEAMKNNFKYEEQ